MIRELKKALRGIIAIITAGILAPAIVFMFFSWGDIALWLEPVAKIIGIDAMLLALVVIIFLWLLAYGVAYSIGRLLK